VGVLVGKGSLGDSILAPKVVVMWCQIGMCGPIECCGLTHWLCHILADQWLSICWGTVSHQMSVEVKLGEGYQLCNRFLMLSSVIDDNDDRLHQCQTWTKR
jgi:hypothetical protein